MTNCIPATYFSLISASLVFMFSSTDAVLGFCFMDCGPGNTGESGVFVAGSAALDFSLSFSFSFSGVLVLLLLLVLERFLLKEKKNQTKTMVYCQVELYWKSHKTIQNKEINMFGNFFLSNKLAAKKERISFYLYTTPTVVENVFKAFLLFQIWTVTKPLPVMGFCNLLRSKSTS